MSTFKREHRYLVIKLSDAEKALGDEQMRMLDYLSSLVDKGRIQHGKPLLQCVVIESDWPEYEPTWAAIAARMSTGAAAREGGE